MRLKYIILPCKNKSCAPILAELRGKHTDVFLASV